MAMPFLTASEIGAYAFCPQAWYLQRRKAKESPMAAQLLARGTIAHQHIGHQTDRLRQLENFRFLLLVIIIAVAVLLCVQLGRAFSGAS
jgi:hypothetical protein